MISKRTIAVLILCIGFASSIFALEVDDSLPPALMYFAKAWNARSFELVEPYIAPSFEIGGVPNEHVKRVLTQVFSQAPHQINRISLTTSSKTNMGTTFTVLLERSDTDREVDFVIGKDGRILSTTLFQATVKAVKKPEAVNQPEHKVLPFELYERMILISGELNGERVDFILDSGAPIFVYNSKYQKEPNSVVISNSSGVGGSIKGVGTQKLKSLSWPGGEYKDFDVVSMDLSHLEDKLGRKFAGLLSQAELEPYETIIDYDKQEIHLFALDDKGERIHKNAAKHPKSIIPFELEGHIPIVSARIGKLNLNMGLDTGAQANLLDKTYLQSLSKMISHTEIDTVMGADTNAMPVTSGMIKSTKVARKGYGKMKYAFSDLSHFNEAYKVDVHGLLGFPFLSQKAFGINYRKQELCIY